VHVSPFNLCIYGDKVFHYWSLDPSRKLTCFMVSLVFHRIPLWSLHPTAQPSHWPLSAI
jgi:hypothetical protein